MKVTLERITKSAGGGYSDAVISIECQCTNKSMLDESDGFLQKEIFVYLHGVRIKNFRCTKTGSECRERYRTTLHMDEDPAFIEVVHISPRPSETVLETIKIEILPKHC